MKERPILFSGPMVRALLRDPSDPLCKTETRRVCKDAANEVGEWAGSVHPTGSGRSWISWWPSATAEETVRLYPGDKGFRCPYGVPGDRLWVRETWRAEPSVVFYAAGGARAPAIEPYLSNDWAEKVGWVYVDGLGWRIGEQEYARQPWRPSIHMPRWASRLTLAVESVRVERLHDIDDAGARREGIADREAYRALWEDINGAGSWDVNPWVWVVGFRRVTS